MVSGFFCGEKNSVFQMVIWWQDDGDKINRLWSGWDQFVPWPCKACVYHIHCETNSTFNK